MIFFSRIPVSINDNKYTWNINGDEITHNFECIHEETDTRMVWHAAFLSDDVVVVPLVQMFDFDKSCVFKDNGLTKMGF